MTNDVRIIDQHWLPSEFRIATLKARDQFATNIRDIWVCGETLIGATAGSGVAMEMAADYSDQAIDHVWHTLNETMPIGHVVTVDDGNFEASLRLARLEYDTLAQNVASIGNIFAGAHHRIGTARQLIKL